MKRIVPAIAAALVMTYGTAWSQTETAPAESEPTSEIEQMLINGLTRGMNIIAATVGSVIPYELPEVLPSGDIIIRRKPPKEYPPSDPAEPFTPKPSQTNQRPDLI